MLDFSRFTTLTFDCYGTLIDWERGILDALRPVLASHGVTLTDDQTLETFGELEAAAEAGAYRTYREVLASVLDGLGARFGFMPDDAERAAFGASVADWPPFPDSAQALTTLGRHYRLAVISNVDDDLFAHSARKLGVTFSEVVTAQQAGSYKPDRRNFDLALERLGTPREQILHVAQSLFHDIAPAGALGLTTVWVNRRHDQTGHGATPPAEATPDLEVPDLRTLAELATKGAGNHA